MPNNQAICIENSQLTKTLNEHQATSELILQNSEKMLKIIKLLKESETVSQSQLQQIKSELQAKNCDLTKLDDKLELLKTNRSETTDKYYAIILDSSKIAINSFSQLEKEKTERYKLKADLNTSIVSKLWNFFFGSSEQTKIAEIDAMTKIAEIDAMTDLIFINNSKVQELADEYTECAESFYSLKKDNDEQIEKITDLKNEKLNTNNENGWYSYGSDSKSFDTPVRTTFKTNPRLTLKDSNVESFQSQCLLQ